MHIFEIIKTNTQESLWKFCWNKFIATFQSIELMQNISKELKILLPDKQQQTEKSIF